MPSEFNITKAVQCKIQILALFLFSKLCWQNILIDKYFILVFKIYIDALFRVIPKSVKHFENLQ
jgi:hypothetical protein